MQNTPDELEREADSYVSWYDKAGRRNRNAFFMLESLKLTAAAVTPVLALAGAPKLATAILAASVVVIEGFQQLGRFNERWVSYRGTCEILRKERFLFRHSAGPYGQTEKPERLLAERTSRILEMEQNTWQAIIRGEQHAHEPNRHE